MPALIFEKRNQIAYLTMNRPEGSQLAESGNVRRPCGGVEGDRQRRRGARDDRDWRGQGRVLGRRRLGS